MNGGDAAEYSYTTIIVVLLANNSNRQVLCHGMLSVWQWQIVDVDHRL